MKKSFAEKIRILKEREATEQIAHPKIKKKLTAAEFQAKRLAAAEAKPISPADEFAPENLVELPISPRGKHRTKTELSERFQAGIPLSDSESLRLFGPAVSDIKSSERISRDKFFQDRMNKMQSANEMPPIEKLPRKHKRMKAL